PGAWPTRSTASGVASTANRNAPKRRSARPSGRSRWPEMGIHVDITTAGVRLDAQDLVDAILCRLAEHVAEDPDDAIHYLTELGEASRLLRSPAGARPGMLALAEETREDVLKVIRDDWTGSG